MNEDFIVALTRVATKVEGMERELKDLKEMLRPPKTPVLPVTGGLVGFLALVWTAYLQATGQT